MAQNQIHTLFILCLASSISMTLLLSVEAKKTKFTIYFQDYAFGPNTTFFPVVGLPGSTLNYTDFGTFFVTDDSITATPNEDALSIGRAQGIYVVTGLDGRNLLVLLSLVFTGGKFNGSSIEIQGTSRQFDLNRELPVVAGTGKFRLTRGFINTDTVSFDAARGYSVIQVNVTLIY
ncbi:dirigent protein 19-like [Momordica charantia]|uniref:Dirigent protein n=1 Tax=Momordica charantia TaxID=3673 RepID=A0A6J1C376_MOMCH|nr:dirigent protein 19-like [Momordica charantia]